MQDKEFAAILQDEPMQPLALVPLTEEEQVRHHQHTLFLNEIKSDVISTSARKSAVLSVYNCGCVLTFLTFPLFHSFHSLSLSLSLFFSLSAEEFLHVCEQCGGAKAHGKRGGWGCPSWSGPRTRGHTRRSR